MNTPRAKQPKIFPKAMVFLDPTPIRPKTRKSITRLVFYFLVLGNFSTASLLADESTDAANLPPNSSKVIILGKSQIGSLSVLIKRRVSTEFKGEEIISCLFFRGVSNGWSKLITQSTSEPGFPRGDIAQVDDFLGNGRKQVLVATWENNIAAKIYDFDGKTLRTIYDSDTHDGRKYLNIAHLRDGRAVLQEEFSATGGGETPKGSIYVKDRNLFVRVVRWQNGRWIPMKFLYMAATDSVKDLRP